MLALLFATWVCQPQSLAAEEPVYGPVLPEDGRLELQTSVRSSLEATLVDALGPSHGPSVAQVAKRLVVWFIDPRRDLRAGDRLELVYSMPPAPQEPIIHALSLQSQKHDRRFAVLRHRPEGARWPRYYDAEGRELELRLVDGPIESYEQVTSLLGDGRGHKGVDFKAPVGTPIRAPFAGTVTRRNWSTRSNGRCVELVAKDSGMKAYFLHLSEIAVRPGQSVEQGRVLGRSGNTGRSTAPHLHYQLHRSDGQVIDPYRVHETRRRSLPPSARPAFQAAWRRSFQAWRADASP
ncbi:MAG: M23 family metallopeptidase [Myxococcota bacterium]